MPGTGSHELYRRLLVVMPTTRHGIASHSRAPTTMEQAATAGSRVELPFDSQRTSQSFTSKNEWLMREARAGGRILRTTEE
jgi:hypothetical protein